MNSAVKITVERSKDGKWSVSVFRSNGDLIGISSGADNELFNPAWFGIFYRYSSTRDRLLWIDDVRIDGTFYEDNKPPAITFCQASAKNSVEIILSEEPANDEMIPENFSLNHEPAKAISVLKVSDLIYRIVFAESFENKSLNTLNIKRICDVSGNCTLDSRLEFFPVWVVNRRCNNF